MWLSNNNNMKKLKITIALFFISALALSAQSFQEPFSDYFSMKECYVITNDGEHIHGKLRSAADSRGFITRVTIVDAQGVKHKFKAADIQRFVIKPDAFTKLRTLDEYSTSVEHVLKTDHDNILDREWVYYDAQPMPRRKNKVGLLQLLNPGFEEYIKVYHHPNGSKSMTVRVGGINWLGGKERTYWVVKGEGKPQIVRKSSFNKSFEWMFADEAEMRSALRRKADFGDFAGHIQAYNELRYKSLLSKNSN